MTVLAPPAIAPTPAGNDDPGVPQRIAADPTASVWVTASAGTGKTKVLIDRVLNLLLDGTPPHRLLCLTFTKAAAAEMSRRIASKLSLWATVPDDVLEKHLHLLTGRTADAGRTALARRLFALVLDTPGGMKIETIHAFCQSLLGRFPLEAGVSPHFDVLDERDAEELLIAARNRTLLAAEQDGGALAEAIATVTANVRERGFAELMTLLAADRGRLGHFIQRCGSIDGAAAAIRRRLGLAEGDTADTIRERASAEVAVDRPGLVRAVNALLRGSDTDRKRGETIAGWLTAQPAERTGTLAEYTAVFLTKDGNVRKPLITKPAAKADPDAADILLTEAERLIVLQDRLCAAELTAKSIALVRLGWALLQAYQALKEARSLLDYNDLIEKAAGLLEGDGAASWVLYKLDEGIDHLLVDEAQDTSPAQWRVIRALTEEFFAGRGAREVRRTVFAVGDVKQSIFSFQGADPDAFVSHRDRFGAHITAAGETWRPVELNISFRSTRAVLNTVDAVFRRIEASRGVAIDGRPIIHRAWRHRDGGSVEIWPPIEPSVSLDPSPWNPPVATVADAEPQVRLARLIAARIHAMIGGDDLLPSKGRPVRPGDIMILVRRRTVFLDELVRMLKSLAVPVAGIDRMLLTDQIAVNDLVAVGRFALFPDDDLTLACVLKSPLIGIDEETLFRLCHPRPGSLWRSLTAAAHSDPALADAHARLADLLAEADLKPPFEFFTQMLSAYGGRRALLARLGPDAEDAIAEFLELALAYERTHAPSLQGFLQWLESSTVEVKRDPEQGERDAVRVMTVHGAKGLQAPIVFLPDTCQVPTRSSPFLWSTSGDTGNGDHGDDDAGDVPLWSPGGNIGDDVSGAARDHRKYRESDEHRRLLYVALTRAEDRLIVCGWHTKKAAPQDCWYRLIRDGLTAPGLNPPAVEVEDAFLAASGFFTDSPAVLHLTCPQDDTVREEKAAGAAAEPLPPWACSPAPPEPELERPLAPSHLSEAPPVLSPLSGDGDGAQRFRRGRIIHRLLQSLPDIAEDARAAAAAAWLAHPAHGLDGAQQAAILLEVLAVLDDPLCRPLFGPDSVAEVPFSGTVAGRPISGQIDRLVVSGDSVRLLDFKTDREPPADASAVPTPYLRQMAAYRAVVRLIYPGHRVCCLLVWTDGPSITDLPDSILDRYAP